MAAGELTCKSVDLGLGEQVTGRGGRFGQLHWFETLPAGWSEGSVSWHATCFIHDVFRSDLETA